MTIHADHPFMPDPEDRDPLRRFRGRLPAPVTIVTAGTPDWRAGLTVSSLLILEGEPGEALLLVNPNSDLWDIVEETGRLVIHVCSTDDRSLAEVFAGRQPIPGGAFASLSISDSRWGPVIDELPNRVYVTVTSADPGGWSGVVRGGVDQVEVANTTDPLVYFRGRYRSLN